MDRVDDEGLADDAPLWRRIIPSWITYEDGVYRPGSFAFIDRLTYEISVFVASLTDIEAVLKDHPTDSLVQISAKLPRSIGGIVAKTPEDPNPSHRVICYPNPSQMKKAGKLLVQSGNFEWVWLLPPEPKPPVS